MGLHLGFIFLLLVLFEATNGRPGDTIRIDYARLKSPEIRELVRDALDKVSPCAELRNLLCGTMQISDGVKYRFRIKTHTRPNCGNNNPGTMISVLRIYIPADRSVEPMIQME